MRIVTDIKASLVRYPDDRMAVVILANSAAARQGKIADLVAAHYLPALAAFRPPAIVDLDPAGTAQARKAMGELLAGRVPESLSASERGRFTLRWVTRIAAELRDVGPLRTVDVLGRGSEGDGWRARYRFLFENETVLVALNHDRDGLIEKLGISLE